jgi:hypothetical protein
MEVKLSDEEEGGRRRNASIAAPTKGEFSRTAVLWVSVRH